MPCDHDLVDREMAVHDGMCPICIASEIEEARYLLGRCYELSCDAPRGELKDRIRNFLGLE